MGVIRYIAGMVFVAITLSSVHAAEVIAPSPATGASEQTLARKSPPGFSQTGRATYYHKNLRGLETATGERYDPNAMTAAHKRLKLGTHVRVIHLRNKRSVIVKVNDRLPPRSRAIIDLSTLAARKLGMIRAGIAKVRIEALSKAEVEELAGSP